MHALLLFDSLTYAIAAIIRLLRELSTRVKARQEQTRANIYIYIPIIAEPASINTSLPLISCPATLREREGDIVYGSQNT